MPGLIGKKVGMTSVFDTNGNNVPCTVIEVGPCTVTQIKTIDTDGYNSVQLGYLETQSKLLNKPELGHLRKTGSPPLKYLKEYRVESSPSTPLGSVLSVDLFNIGDKISVTGKTIGKGFAGTVKRHNFTRGPMTHG
jgi:large subunit ribosomal protein L3